MTIDKAIKENEDLLKVGTNRLSPAEVKAVGLGNEALNGIALFRRGADTRHLWKLPGETED